MCGPYASMQNFKYRVKLTPGTLKKGKIAKQSIELFTRNKEALAQETNLIRSLTDPEVIVSFINLNSMTYNNSI